MGKKLGLRAGNFGAGGENFDAELVKRAPDFDQFAEGGFFISFHFEITVGVYFAPCFEVGRQQALGHSGTFEGHIALGINGEHRHLRHDCFGGQILGGGQSDFHLMAWTFEIG